MDGNTNIEMRTANHVDEHRYPGWKTHTAEEYAVSSVSCLSNRLSFMLDIALTSFLTEKA